MTERATSERATQTIQAIHQAIINDDLDFLKRLLDTLPLNKLDKQIGDSLLFRFLLICAQYDKVEATRILFEFWEIPFIALKGPVSVYSSLYLDPRYNPQLLAFCNKAMKTYTFTECISQLMELDDNQNLSVACYKLLQVYGEQTLTTYRNLAELTIDKNNVIYNFIVDQIRPINEYAPIPDYLIVGDMIPRESEVSIPTYQEPDFEIPDNDRMVDLLLDGMADQGLSIIQIDEAKDLLRSQLSIMTFENKRRLLEPVMELKFSQDVLQNDRILFTILGPSNPDYNATREEMKYGGARMFLSGAFDFDPDDDFQEEPFEWFHPYCDYCSRKIRRKWHALRMPVQHGGWRGCYCSFECLESSIEQSDEDEIVTQLLSDIFKQQFYDIGILDRIPDKEYQLYLEGKLELSFMNKKDQAYFDSLYKPKMLDETQRAKVIDLNNLPVKEQEATLLENEIKKKPLIEMIEILERFYDLIKTSSIKPVIIYFYRANCGACTSIKPYFEYYSSNNTQYVFGQVNINSAKLRKLTKDLKIDAVPTFIRYENEREVSKVIGADEGQLDNLINH